MVYEKAVCKTITKSWSSARKQCQIDGQQLLSSDSNTCLSNGEQYWYGRYSEEKIFWKNGNNFHYYTIYSYVHLTTPIIVHLKRCVIQRVGAREKNHF